jgi:ribosomal protein L37AE/L43A
MDKVIEGTINRNIESHNIKLNQFCNDNNLTIINHKENTILLKCNKCNSEFELQRSPYTYWKYDRCSKCFPKFGGKSYEEKEFLEWVKSIYSGNIIENSRQIIPPKEIDIYIPEFKLGLEYNGVYWHTGDRKRHREKWELAQQKNIDLIQIWSSEWRDSRPILQSIIKNRLGLSIPIYARECKISEVSSKEAREFSNRYHLQGYFHGINIGLYYNNELIDLSIFCKCRFGNRAKWELTRHCIKSGYRIIGGLSREISYFRKIGNTGSIIDYCDMRLFNGKGHWGFKEIEITPPDMQYSDYNNIIPRGKFQKHKMKNIDNFKFDSKLTQRQNLLNNGMDYIYGVGHKIFLMD